MRTKVGSGLLSHGWLDSFAVGMSVICAIHCMVTPLVMVVLPVVATSLWAHKDFHLWMLLLVVPTTALSMYLGCRKHKNKCVMVLAFIGIGILAFMAVYESFFYLTNGSQVCAHCVHGESESLLNLNTLINVVGATFLATAHVYNYLLCRKTTCCRAC